MKIPLLTILLLLPASAQEPKRLTLAGAEAAALRNHPRIRAAQATARAAALVTAEIKSAYLPSVTASATAAQVQSGTAVAAGNVTTSGLGSRSASGIWGTQLITDFGRTSKLAESAQHRAGAQQEAVSQTRARILLDVRQSFFQALLTESVLRVAQDTLSARRLTLKQVSALAQGNLKSTLDVSFAEVNVSEAELALFRAENDVRAAFADLSAALGANSDEEYALVDEPMPPPLDDDPAGLISKALIDRPELAALRQNLEAARSFAASEKRLWLPTIGIIGTAGVLPTHEDRLHNSYSGVGLNVSIPVLNGGLFSARRAEAENRAEAAGQQVKDLEIRVGRDVRIAWLNARTAFKRLDVTARLLDQARHSLNLAQARYKLGLSSIVELTQAQLNETSAEIADAGAKYEYYMRRAALDYESGSIK